MIAAARKVELVWLCAALTVFCGPLAPIIQYQFGRSADYYQNPVWDFLYGIGYEIGYVLFQEVALSVRVGLVGFVFWPLALIYLMVFLGKKIALANVASRFKVCVFAVFSATLVVYVPSALLTELGVPTFTKLSAVNF